MKQMNLATALLKGAVLIVMALSADLSGHTRGYDAATKTYRWDAGVWNSSLTLANLNPNQNFKACAANRFHTHDAGLENDTIKAVQISWVDIVDWENQLFGSNVLERGFVGYKQDGRAIKIAIWDKNPIDLDITTGVAKRAAKPIYMQYYKFAVDFTDASSGTHGIGNDYGSNRRPLNTTPQEITKATGAQESSHPPFAAKHNYNSRIPIDQYPAKFTTVKLILPVKVQGKFWVGFIATIPPATTIDTTVIEAHLDWIGIGRVDTRQAFYQGVTGPSGVVFENNRPLPDINFSPVGVAYSDPSSFGPFYADEVLLIRAVGCENNF